jgi:hypothetical protein
MQQGAIREEPASTPDYGLTAFIRATVCLSLVCAENAGASNMNPVAHPARHVL